MFSMLRNNVDSFFLRHRRNCVRFLARSFQIRRARISSSGLASVLIGMFGLSGMQSACALLSSLREGRKTAR